MEANSSATSLVSGVDAAVSDVRIGPSDPPPGVPQNPLEVWDHTLQTGTWVIDGSYAVRALNSKAAFNELTSNQPALAAYLGFKSENDFLSWQNEPTVAELSDLYLQGRIGLGPGEVPVGASSRRKKA